MARKRKKASLPPQFQKNIDRMKAGQIGKKRKRKAAPKKTTAKRTTTRKKK